jgi:hypothetical protein
MIRRGYYVHTSGNGYRREDKLTKTEEEVETRRPSKRTVSLVSLVRRSPTASGPVLADVSRDTSARTRVEETTRRTIIYEIMYYCTRYI